MPGKKRRTRRDGRVSASELAQMAVCERLVVFEHRFGKRPTRAQMTAIGRGLRAHERFARNGLSAPQPTGRCFIATLLFGVGQETLIRHEFRDLVLTQCSAERWLIAMYYRASLGICWVLAHLPIAKAIARAMLRPVVWWACRRLRSGEASDVD